MIDRDIARLTEGEVGLRSPEASDARLRVQGDTSVKETAETPQDPQLRESLRQLLVNIGIGESDLEQIRTALKPVAVSLGSSTTSSSDTIDSGYEGSAEKLLAVLNALSDGLTQTTEQGLREFISSHVQGFSDLGADLNGRAQSAQPRDDLSQVMELLKSLEGQLPQETDLSSKSFKEFIVGFQKEFAVIQERGASNQEIGEYLSQALQDLNSLVASTSKDSKISMSESELPASTYGAVIQLEESLRLAIRQVDQSTSSPAGVAISEVMEVVKSIDLSKLEKGVTGAEELRAFIRTFRQELEAVVEQNPSNREVGKVLTRALYQAGDFLSAANSSSSGELAPKLRVALENLVEGLQAVKLDFEMRDGTQRLDSPVSDFLQRLETLGSRMPGDGVATAKELDSFFKNYMELSHFPREDVSRVLSLVSESDSLAVLQQTVGRIERLVSADSSGAEKQLRDIVQRLRSDLEQMFEAGSSKQPEAVRQALSAALQSLVENFRAEGDKQAVSNQLPEEYQKLLGVLEMQLRTLLNAFGGESGSVGGENSISLPTGFSAFDAKLQIGDLLKSLQEFENSLNSSIEKQNRFTELVRTLGTSLNEFREKGVSGQVLRELLNSALKDLEVILGKTGEMSEGGDSRGLTGRYGTAARSLEAQLRTLLSLYDTESSSSPPTVQIPAQESLEALARVLQELSLDVPKNPPVNRSSATASGLWENPSSAAEKLDARTPSDMLLDQLLLRLREISARSEGAVGEKTQAGENGFLNVVRDLIHRLESRSSGQNEGETRQLLTRTVRDLQEAFASSKGATLADTVRSAQLKAVQELGNLVRGQEVLNRLNPIMGALGEPALILFPSLLQGFLSKVELAYYPHLVHNQFSEDEEKRSSGRNASKKNKDGKKDPYSDSNEEGSGGPGNYYRKIQFRVHLPHLGDVTVDFAQSLKSLLINLSVENEQSSEFVNNAAIELHGIFAALGYESVDCTVSSAKTEDPRPRWFRELLEIPGIVA